MHQEQNIISVPTVGAVALALRAVEQLKAGGATGAAGEADAQGAAPCPPALTGGESTHYMEGLGAKVDWLTATWKPDAKYKGEFVQKSGDANYYHPELNEHVVVIDQANDFILDLLDSLRAFMGEVYALSVNGMFGYAQGATFFKNVHSQAVQVARVDFGGEFHGGRARLDLSGTGCSKVNDWAGLHAWVIELDQVKFTRVDLAVDCLNGEYTVEDARDWYLGGEFNCGGRMPRHSTPGDWLGETKYGRTLEVGRRENGKMLRAYEKGRQLGDPDSLWTRFEVEIRNKDRDIPLDILIRRDHYFAGAYACCEKLLPVAAERIATHQKEGEIADARLTEHHANAYGRHIYVKRMYMTADEIIEELSRPGVPKRLAKSALGGFDPKASPAFHSPGVVNHV
nr:replication initiation factor domain-containing protein [uncultured Deefgea sp.]